MPGLKLSRTSRRVGINRPAVGPSWGSRYAAEPSVGDGNCDALSGADQKRYAHPEHFTSGPRLPVAELDIRVHSVRHARGGVGVKPRASRVWVTLLGATPTVWSSDQRRAATYRSGPAPFCERPAFVGRLPLIRVGTRFVQARSVVSVGLALALSTVVFTLVIAIKLIDIQYRPVV
jgi:hypothetical protein